MSTNVYGGVKDAATGKPAPAGMPAAEPNGKPYSAQADSEKRREIREATNAPVYGCQTREEWLGADVVAALAELQALWGDAPQTARSREATLYWREQQAHALIAWIEGKRRGRLIALDKTPDKIADKNSPDSDNPSRNQPEIADKKPVMPQSLQSPSEVLVDAAIAKQKAAKGTSRLDELKDGIRDGVLNYDERKDAEGRVPLFDDIYLWRTTAAISVKHPENPNSVVVAVPGRDGKPELCKDTTDELTVFLMRIRDGQKKIEHKALATVNEPEAKPIAVEEPVKSTAETFGAALQTASRFHDPNLYAIVQCQALVKEMSGWPPIKAEAA